MLLNLILLVCNNCMHDWGFMWLFYVCNVHLHTRLPSFSLSLSFFFFYNLSFELLSSRYLENTKQVVLWVLLEKKTSRIINTSIVIIVNDHLKWQKNDKFYINLTEFREIFHIFPHIVVSYSDHVFIKKQFWNTIFFSLLFFLFFLRQIPLCIQIQETGAWTHFVFETDLYMKATAHHMLDQPEQNESPTQLSWAKLPWKRKMENENHLYPFNTA